MRKRFAATCSRRCPGRWRTPGGPGRDADDRGPGRGGLCWIRRPTAESCSRGSLRDVIRAVLARSLLGYEPFYARAEIGDDGAKKERSNTSFAQIFASLVDSIWRLRAMTSCRVPMLYEAISASIFLFSAGFCLQHFRTAPSY